MESRQMQMFDDPVSWRKGLVRGRSDHARNAIWVDRPDICLGRVVRSGSAAEQGARSV